MKVRLVITGRDYHARGNLPDQLEMPEGADLDEALRHLEQLLPEGEALPASCLVAVSGRHVGTVAHHESPRLRDHDELVLVAPVAGG